MQRLFNFRPMVAFAISFAVGITCSLVAILLNIIVSLAVAVSFLVFIVIYFLILPNKALFTTFIVVLLFFIIGISLVFIRFDYFEFFECYSEKIVLVEGRVKTVEVIGSDNYFAKVVIEKAKLNGNKIYGNLMIYSYSPSFQVSDLVRLEGEVFCSKANKYYASMLGENIPLYLYSNETLATEAGQYTIFENFYFSFKNSLDKTLGEYSPFAIAMLTGDTDFISSFELKNMQMAGVGHIFSVSGLHISFLAGFVGFLLNKLNLKRMQKTIIIFIVTTIYSGVCKFTPSSVRAVIMCTVLLSCRSFGRKYDFLSSIALSMIVVLLINPFDVINIGFQLSFGAVISIALFQRTFTKIFAFLPRKLSTVVAISCAVQFGTAPISSYYFGYLSVVSIFLNVIFIPFCSILFIVLVLSEIIIAIFPFFNAIMIIPRLLLVGSDKFFQLLDFSRLITTLNLSLPTVVGYYPFALLSAEQVNTTNRIKYCAVAFCVVYIIIFAI